MGQLAIYSFDTDTPNANISPSSPWVKAGATPMTALAAAAVHGSLGGRITAPTSLCTLSWVNPGGSGTTTHVIDCYVRPRAVPGNLYIFSLADGATSRGSVRIQADGLMALRDGMTAVATSSTPIAIDGSQVYRMAWMVNTSGQELRVYEGEGITPLLTLTGALTNAAHKTLIAGLTSNLADAAVDIDTVRIADEWLPPFGTPSIPLPTPTGFTVTPQTGSVAALCSWSAVAGAGSYEIDVDVPSAAPGVWDDVTVVTVTSGTSRMLTAADGLEPGRAYRARVRAMPVTP